MNIPATNVRYVAMTGPGSDSSLVNSPDRLQRIAAAKIETRLEVNIWGGLSHGEERLSRKK